MGWITSILGIITVSVYLIIIYYAFKGVDVQEVLHVFIVAVIVQTATIISLINDKGKNH